MNPFLHPYLEPFFSLQYPVDTPANPDSFPNSNYYAIGPLDGCFVITWIAIFALLREVLRVMIFEPFARNWLASRATKEGTITPQRLQPTTSSATTSIAPIDEKSPESLEMLRSRKSAAPKLDKITKQRRKGMTKEQWLRERSALRFAEQGWPFVFYSIYWAFGFYIHLNLPHSIWKPQYLWLDYPHTPLAGPIKFYYLTQFASWLHQVLVLNAEAKRKDHWQMMSHHVITIALLAASYCTNFTRVGCLIMVLMDLCDIWLPFAKMFRYLGLATLCDTVFGIFLVSWLMTRHILFGLVIWSAYYDAATLLPFTWEPERGHFLNSDWYGVFLALLVALQIILLIWFGTICRITWKIVTGGTAEDIRSDEEGESPSDDDDEPSGISKPTSARDEPKRKMR